MNYLRAYRKFIYSYYFTNGLKTTFGIVVPSLIFAFFGLLSQGILISLGALCMSIADSPGPYQERKNTFFAGIALITLCAFVTVAFSFSSWLGYVFVILAGFGLSMLTVYGNRAANTGLAGILTIIFSLEHKGQPQEALVYALYFLSGGAWYAFISLATYRIRPYLLIQQALGACIFQTAGYIRLKAGFYGTGAQYPLMKDQLIHEQVEISKTQETARELLFQQRTLTKDTTLKGRYLLIILLDIIDIYERIMASHVDYAMLHQYFDGKGILPGYQEVILNVASQLDDTALAVIKGKPLEFNDGYKAQIEKLQKEARALRSALPGETELAPFIALRNLRENLDQIFQILARMQRSSRREGETERGTLRLSEYVTAPDFSKEKLFDNLNQKSSAFRHSIRVFIAMLTSSLLAAFLPGHHGYWILLTALVILKPGFSLSRKRNAERLWGTFLGTGVGVLCMLTVTNNQALLIVMIFFMVISYSFSNIAYWLSTLSTTVFVLIFFKLINQGQITVLEDRLLDTALGSGVAFLVSYFILPTYELHQIVGLATRMLETNRQYLIESYEAYRIRATLHAYKLSRKEMLVSAANLGTAFERMLTDPRSKRFLLQDFHAFVVLNHELSGHIATLGSHLEFYTGENDLALFTKAFEVAEITLGGAIETLATGIRRNGEETLYVFEAADHRLQALTTQRLSELGMGQMETKTRHQLSEMTLLTDQFKSILTLARDIELVCAKMSSK